MRLPRLWKRIKNQTELTDLIGRADAMGAVQEHFDAGGFKGYSDGQKMMDRIMILSSAELPKDDLISRADAIEMALTYFIPRSHTGERGEHEEDFVRTIFNALPSAEPKTKCVAQIKVDTEEIVKRIKEEYDITYEWIPCSERLPSESGNYLITVADLRLGHNGEHAVTIADFYVKAKKWNSIVDVYAWMPLPEPYREESEVEG